MEYLRAQYGTETVSVTDCATFDCRDWSLSNFIDYLHDVRGDNGEREVLYLKDWHLVLVDPSFYQTPKHFQSDWLNEYCLAQSKSDYRFVYIGPRHSKTPIHRDVLLSHSWSANITGKKLWHFWSPEDGDGIMPHVGKYVGVF